MIRVGGDVAALIDHGIISPAEHSRSVFAMWFLTEREKRQVLYIALVITDVVHLEGGMGDIELVGEELFEFAAAGVAVFVAADEDMG